jgi:outer membrane protein OmpA-like peptidoglycan-associated protein
LSIASLLLVSVWVAGLPGAAPAAAVDPGALSAALSRMDRVVPAVARRAILSASESRVHEFITSDMVSRLVPDEGGSTPLNEQLKARGITAGRDVSWLLLSAYRQRAGAHPLDVDALIAATRARRARLDREAADRRAALRARGVILFADPIEILDQIGFGARAADLDQGGRGLSQVIAELLVRNPGILLLEIRGHVALDEADPAGLDQRRADAVRDDLIARGVAAERLATSAAGTDPQPPAVGLARDTRNRRVDFAILRTAGPER